VDVTEFEQDKKIDPGALDIEACQQAELFFKWAERAIDARHEYDQAKFRMGVKEADLAIRIRKEPSKFGIAKVTDKSVDAAISKHPEYQEAHEDYLDARRNSMLLDKAVDAMEQKKRMIEVMITLHGQSYFAGPSVPRDIVSAFHEKTKEREESTDRRMAKKARRRKRRLNDD
jgi:hypothetical protein